MPACVMYVVNSTDALPAIHDQCITFQFALVDKVHTDLQHHQQLVLVYNPPKDETNMDLWSTVFARRLVDLAQMFDEFVRLWNPVNIIIINKSTMSAWGI